MRRLIAAVLIASALAACAAAQPATSVSAISATPTPTTAAPTVVPSTAPQPTQTPTLTPSTSPPTLPPTAAPVAATTAPPPTPVVVTPSPAPTVVPTNAPSAPPTIAPTTPPGPRPTVMLVHSADNYMHVQFDRAMAQSGTGAANALGSYQLDGRPLPGGSTIICGSPSCDVVRIDMPENLPRGSAHLMRVAGVVAANGAPLNPDPTVTSFRTDLQSDVP